MRNDRSTSDPLSSRARRMLRGLHRGRKAAYLRVEGRLVPTPLFTVKSVKQAMQCMAGHVTVSTFTFE